MILSLEKQVCGLESAKRLKELGFVQQSLFYWYNRVLHGDDWVIGYDLIGMEWVSKESVSAYNVAELGELLPANIKYKEESIGFLGIKIDETIHSSLKKKIYKATYQDLNSDDDLIGFNADTESEARAKMLIYLKENKLI